MTESEVVSFKLDADVLDRLEKTWRVNQYKNRSQYIQKAIVNLMDSVECPFCGAVNPRGARICAVCLRALTAEDEERILITMSEKKQIEEKS